MNVPSEEGKKKNHGRVIYDQSRCFEDPREESRAFGIPEVVNLTRRFHNSKTAVIHTGDVLPEPEDKAQFRSEIKKKNFENKLL